MDTSRGSATTGLIMCISADVVVYQLCCGIVRLLPFYGIHDCGNQLNAPKLLATPTHLSTFKDVPAYSMGFAILTQSFSLDSDYAKYNVLL